MKNLSSKEKIIISIISILIIALIIATITFILLKKRKKNNHIHANNTASKNEEDKNKDEINQTNITTQEDKNKINEDEINQTDITTQEDAKHKIIEELPKNAEGVYQIEQSYVFIEVFGERYYLEWFKNSDLSTKDSITLTRAIQTLLFVEVKTNDYLVAYERMSEIEKIKLKNGETLKFKINRGIKRYDKEITIDNEKYKEIQELTHFIYDIVGNSLIDGNLETNNKLINALNEKIIPKNDNSEALKKLKENIKFFLEKKEFKSDNRRFADSERTVQSDKIYKKKNENGFFQLTGRVLPGLSTTSLQLKDILKPSKNFKKYLNTWIEINRKLCGPNEIPLAELYKSEVFRIIDMNFYKIRNNANRTQYIKMIEDKLSYEKIVRNKDREYLSVKDLSEKQKKSFFRHILFAYILNIGDRHRDNFLTDFTHIDLDSDKYGDKFFNDHEYYNGANISKFLKYIHQKDFKNAVSEMPQLIKMFYNPSQWSDESRKIFYDICKDENAPKYLEEVLKEIASHLDPKKLEDIKKCKDEYEKDSDEQHWKEQKDTYGKTTEEIELEKVKGEYKPSPLLDFDFLQDIYSVYKE